MKTIALRKAFLAALAVLVGVFCGRLLTVNVIACIVTPLAVVAGGVILFFIGKKKILILVTAIALGLGMAASAIDFFTRYDGEISGEKVIRGRLCEERAYGYLLEDLETDGKTYHGKLLVYATGYETEVGDIVTIHAKVETFSRDDPFDTYVSAFYNDRIYYKTENFETILVEKGELSFTEKIRKRIDKALETYVSQDDAGVLKSLLFGDKADLSYGDKTVINGIGLAHIFAVSGLHVGFLAAFVLFLLRKCKVNGIVRAIVVSALLLLYGFLTGFPTGLKRVSVFLAATYLGRSLTRKADPPTTLAVAGAIIVLTNPRELFDLGFVMSFASVIGIVCYYKPIYELLKKAGTNMIFVYMFGTIATTISACLFILPISANVFHSFSPYVVLANFVILPLVTVAFPLAAVAAMFSSVWSGFGTLFLPSAYVIKGIRYVADAFARLPFSSVEIMGMGAVTVLYYVMLVLCSRYFKIPKASKYTLLAGTGLSFIVLSVLSLV